MYNHKIPYAHHAAHTYTHIRDEGSSINANTVYEIVTSEIFKGEPDVEYAVDMSFDLVTGGNSALCGIYLEIGDEYLIDLNRYDFGGEESLQAVGLCGLAQLWSTVTEDDQALLRGGCDDYDPCGGTCGDFQVPSAVLLLLLLITSGRYLFIVAKTYLLRVYLCCSRSPWVLTNKPGTNSVPEKRTKETGK